MPFACRGDVVEQAAALAHGDEVEFTGEDVDVEEGLLDRDGGVELQVTVVAKGRRRSQRWSCRNHLLRLACAIGRHQETCKRNVVQSLIIVIADRLGQILLAHIVQSSLQNSFKSSNVAACRLLDHDSFVWLTRAP